MRKAVFVSIIMALALAPQGIRAEGSGDIGGDHVLSAATELHVDILDANTELILWSGSGDLTVYAPDGDLEGVISSGANLSPASGNGAYRLALAEDQTLGWDVSVTGAGGGRLHSYEWRLDGGGFGVAQSIECSFYALQEDFGGVSGESAVVETRFEGYAGWYANLMANSIGTTLADPPTTASGLMSVSSAGTSITPEFALYLGLPERSTFNYGSPTLSSVSVSPAVALAGPNPAVFDFDVDMAGHALLQVDLDGDATYDIVEETVAMIPVTQGANHLEWYGSDTSGAPLADGFYDARLMVVVGLHNLPSVDVETSYLGLRQYAVQVGGSRVPLVMYWNDTAVSSGSVMMPNGLYANETSGPAGVSSGSYAMMAEPDWNSRAWGDFTGSGRGNDSVLNTFTWLSEDISSPVSIEVTNSTVWYRDADTDGFGDSDNWVADSVQPAGYVSDNTDCDDGEPTVYPGAEEICGDGLDNDCNDEVDDGCAAFVLDSVLDVGNDQGRQVRLEWARCADDTAGTSHTVTGYSVYRRVDGAKTDSSPPPAAVPVAWDFLLTVPANGEPKYGTVVPTLCDSTDAGICWSVFFVRAQTTNPLVFFDTPPDSGWSVDNLVPSPPASPKLEGSLLVWDDPLDPDVRYVTVHGSANGVFDGSEILLGYATGSSFDVTGQDHVYYLLTATDFAGNESPASIVRADWSDVPELGPARTALVGNYPNPFNPGTNICFSLPEGQHVRLSVFSVDGRRVANLLDGNMSAGSHESRWNGRDTRGRAMPSGTYFYRLQAGDYVETKRMTLLK